MNKEIEEMVMIIDKGTQTTCALRDKDHKKCSDCEQCWTYAISKILYNAGYRKVYTDRFILKHDKSGYNFTKEEARFEEMCNKCTLQVRKETAKEILQELYNEAVGVNNETIELSAYYIKNTLAKGYGVEL